MIEFCGELSKSCAEYVKKKESRVGTISGIIGSTIFSIPVIFLSVAVNWVFILCLPVLIMMAVLCGMPPSKKNYAMIMPSKIVIDEKQDVIISKSSKFHIEQTVSNVTKVADMGDWYHIYFNDKVDRLGRFVCQKDLICKGTIEDFENIFADTIERICSTQN